MVYSNNFNQVRVGIRNGVVTQVVNAVDADATAFIAAAGITDLTQAAAISTLVNDLKTYGIWSKMKALYPFVGGSATSHKFNLKDPRDVDAAYRLVFSGGWVHSSTGVLPNGTNAYADTKFTPSISWSLSSAHTSYYSRSNISLTSNQVFFDAFISASNCYQIYFDGSNLNLYNDAFDVSSGRVYATPSSYGSRTDGWFIGNRLIGNKIQKNSTIISSNSTSSGTLPNIPLYMSAANTTGGAVVFAKLESAFASIGDGLSDTESTNFYASIQKFQTTLGRQVGTPTVSDLDAQTFLNISGVTDLTQASAINTLVVDLKAAGIWTKMKAVYPFVGGNATSHKFNLKDPRDLDAAFRLVFNGGWTHNSNGSTPNGTNGYADTKMNALSSLINNNYHLSHYSRTQKTTGTEVEIGAIDQSTYRMIALDQYYGGVSSKAFVCGDFISSQIVSNQTNTLGLLIGTRTSQNTSKMFMNGLQSGSTLTLSNSNSLPNRIIYLGSNNNGSNAYEYSTKETSFVSIGDGLTDSEVLLFNKSVQKYQTTLGRQVDVPVVSDTDAQAFLTAASITSYTQATAVNTLVIDLKAAGVWSKMKALYPFVGGTATSHKFNLKDPRDVDAAFRLVFNGGWTHTSTGALSNGTTGYANTYLNLQLLNQNNTHLSLYNNNNYTPTTGSIDMGAYNELGSISGVFIATELVTNLSRARLFFTPLDYSITDNRGYYIVNSNSTNTKYHINNTNVAVSTNSGSFPLISKNIFIGALNANASYDGANYFSNGLYTFSSIGDGLTDSEVASVYTAVQKFQTSLGRQVGTPVYNTNGLVLNLDAGIGNSYPGTGTTWFDLASGNNGTLVNGSTYNSSNGSILFDGVNDYVDIGSNIALSSNITLSAWINQPIISGQYKNIITKEGVSNVSLEYGLTTSPNGNLYFWFYNNGYKIHQTTNNPINSVNNWFYVTSVFDDINNTIKIYVNGVEVYNQIETSSLLSYTNSKILIGWRNSQVSGQSFYGNISSVNVYNRSLSATEILENFNNTRGRFGV